MKDHENILSIHVFGLPNARLRTMRRHLKLLGLKSKELDGRRLQLTAVRNNLREQLKELNKELIKIKIEEDEQHDKYLDALDEFKKLKRDIKDSPSHTFGFYRHGQAGNSKIPVREDIPGEL